MSKLMPIEMLDEKLAAAETEVAALRDTLSRFQRDLRRAEETVAVLTLAREILAPGGDKTLAKVIA